MLRIKKDNKETHYTLERIRRLQDPVEMMEKRKEENKVKYADLMLRMSKWSSGRSTTSSPDGEMHDNIFERNRSHPMRNSSDHYDKNPLGKMLFSDI